MMGVKRGLKMHRVCCCFGSIFVLLQIFSSFEFSPAGATALGVKTGENETGGGGATGSTSDLSDQVQVSVDEYNGERKGVGCICDGNCEQIGMSHCPFGVTLDLCGCCFVCARGLGETCGGANGNCKKSLKCQPRKSNGENAKNSPASEGICSNVFDDELCENPETRFGCLFDGESCTCETQKMCPDMDFFLFDSLDSCKSRVAILSAVQQLPSNVWHVNPPSKLASSPANGNNVESATEDDCSGVRCPKIECPLDSYRLPTPTVLNDDGDSDSDKEEVNYDGSTEVHHGVHGKGRRECCPVLEKCICNPPPCPKPECPTGWRENLVLNATGQPGNCCPLLECSPSQLDERKVCRYAGEEFEAGETWIHFEDCTECSCSTDGVVACQQIKCDATSNMDAKDLDSSVTFNSKFKAGQRGSTPHNACCPTSGSNECVTTTGRVYNNSETWEEDSCTLCECHEGRVICSLPLCQTCENPQIIPGECCPRCTESESGSESAHGSEKKQKNREKLTNGHLDHRLDFDCPPLIPCDDDLDADVADLDDLDLDLNLDTEDDDHRKGNKLGKCPNGVEVDQDGCLVCKCKSGSGKKGGDKKTKTRAKPKGKGRKKQQQQKEKEKMTPFSNSRVFKDDLRMRSNSNNNNLEWPDIEEEDRRKMADEGRRGCQSLDSEVPAAHPKNPGNFRADGEEWSDGCRKCVCRGGREMCTLISCSQPKCENPVFFDNSCCPTCPDEDADNLDPDNEWEWEGVKTPKKVNMTVCPGSGSGGQSAPRVEGDEWSLTPCLTCTCHNGQVLCASPECPPAPCANLTRIPGECCAKCPESNQSVHINTDIDQQEKKNEWRRNSSSSSSVFLDMEKRNCFSDDSRTKYLDGHSWKVGPCQSCKCEDGQISCFSSSGACPRLHCERPVLPKNSCCPICLGPPKSTDLDLDLDPVQKDYSGGKTEPLDNQQRNCTLSGSTASWRHGDRWTLDKCTTCLCNFPLVQCTRIVCAVSCHNPTETDDCCPVCPESQSQDLLDKIGVDRSSSSSSGSDSKSSPSLRSFDSSSSSSSSSPLCIIIIAALLCTNSLLAFFVFRVIYRRRRRRRLNDKSLANAPPPDFCYFNNNKKYDCPSALTQATLKEKKLLCPTV